MRVGSKIRDIRCEGCGRLLQAEIIADAPTKGEKVMCRYCGHVNVFKD